MRKQKDIPIVSGVLVAVNVIVFLICTFTGNLLYNRGRLDIVSVFSQGECGRIIWSMFLHSGVNHIFNNMVLLFFLGAMIEKEVGHTRYLILYFLSGIGGGLLSLIYKVMTFDISGTVGASGAIFGLNGALLALILFSNRTVASPGRVILMIVYSLYSGFISGNIDNAAHIGGLLTGFIVSSFMCIAEKRKRKDERYGFEY